MKINSWFKSIEIFLIIIFISLYSLAASLVSLNRYWQYNAFWYDFGIIDTTIWKLSRFQFPIIPNLNPPSGKIVWADHLNPSAALLSPLYWVSDKQEIILIAQAVVVGLSAFVAYLITRKFISNKVVRFSLIVSYLGFVGMQNALFTDVHNIVFALLPFMLTIWSIFHKRWRLYWLFLLITIGFQENMAAVITMLGAFLILRRERNIKIGIATIVLGFIYGFFSIKILIPLLNGGNYTYQPAIPIVWYDWITRFILPAEIKLRSIFFTFATFGFLPVGALSVLPLIIEHYLERFVLNTAATRWDLGFHYNALLSPIMFLSSVELIIYYQKKPFIRRILTFWALGTIIIVVFMHRFYLHGPLMLATHPVFYQQTENNKFLDSFVADIPRNGLLMTQNNIATHFTHGNIVLLNKNYEKIKPDTIAIDKRAGQNANDFFPMPQEEIDDFIASVSANPQYKKKYITDSQIIFTRNNE